MTAMTFTAVFLDAVDKGASKTITVRFDGEPEDREIESLMLRYDATMVEVDKVK